MNKLLKLTSIAIVYAMATFPVISSANAAASAGPSGGPSGGGNGGGNHNLINKIATPKAVALPKITFKRTLNCDPQFINTGLLNQFWAFGNCK